MSKAIIAALIVAVLGGLGLGTYDPPSNLVQGGVPDIEPVPSMSPVEIVTEEPPAEPSEPVWEEEPVYYDSEPDYWEPEPYVANEGVPDLRSMGVVSDGENTFTWYSERSLPGGGLHDLNNNGRTTNDEGFVTDGDGYIAIASPDESIPIGTEVETPWGTAKVYDYNPGDSWDCYVSW